MGVSLYIIFGPPTAPQKKGKRANEQTPPPRKRKTATQQTACGFWRKKATIHAASPYRKKAMPAPIKDPPYVPPATLPKTDNQRIKELKKMLIEGKGEQVVQKVLDIALDDGHPGQMAALKLCMERALPTSLFEKTAAQRSAINITISGLSSPPEIKDIIDVGP